MLEMLNETFLWWHWIVIGIVLLILEMNTGTFMILGLAIAAIVVGVADYLLSLSFTSELFIWSALSVVALGAWYKWLRTPPHTDSGQSNYRLDTLGTVTEAIAVHRRGKVVFDSPVLGNTAWHATARVDIPENTRIKIVEINGQLIEVEPIPS